MGRRIRRKRQKLVDWHKNGLTELKREKKITTGILIKRKYRVQLSHHLMLSSVLSSKSPSTGHLLHLNTERDARWYQVSHLVG